jgi:hypothetical protein
VENNLTIALAAIMVVMSAAGYVWLAKIRAAKKWNAFLDGYAAREIRRAQRSSLQEK